MVKSSAKGVIKNPNRRKNIQQETYMPEYKRLDKKPVVMFESSLAEEYPSVNFSNISQEDVLRAVGAEYPHDLKQETSQSNNGSQTPPMGSFILMVHGKFITCGSREEILEIVSDIVFGKHPDFSDDTVLEHIVVLKRVDLKFGVSLND